jgi:hypothetical protein
MENLRAGRDKKQSSGKVNRMEKWSDCQETRDRGLDLEFLATDPVKVRVNAAFYYLHLIF